MTLDKNVEELFAEARSRAEKGNTGFEPFLRGAEKYAQKVNVNVSAEVAEIEEVGYKAAVPVCLAEARSRAEKGNTGFEPFLRGAEKYAQKVNVNVSAEVAEIEEVGYKAAVLVYLAEARKFAKRGKVSRTESALMKSALLTRSALMESAFVAPAFMESALDLASIYAQRIGQDISAEVAEIRASVQIKAL